MRFSSDILLTFGGQNYLDLKLYAKVEVTSLGPDNNIDCKIPDMPSPVSFQSTIKTTIGIISCGGMIGYEGKPYQFSRKCYKLASNNSWIQFPTMNKIQSGFAMGEGNGILFSLGEKSMEWIDLKNGMRWTQQDLPFTINNHCMTNFNQTHLIVTGGLLNDNHPLKVRFCCQKTFKSFFTFETTCF